MRPNLRKISRCSSRVGVRGIDSAGVRDLGKLMELFERETLESFDLRVF